MLRSVRPVVLTGLFWFAGPGEAAAQDWVSHVKSRPLEYRDREIVLEGEAVEVRALSPRSTRGLYRLVDGTDPVGVFIRTNELPTTGGPFRVRARLAPELLFEDHLLLEETDRGGATLPLMPLALVVAAAGLAGVAVAMLLYRRLRRDEREQRIGQPMWLIPVEDPGQRAPDPGTGGPAPFDYRLKYIEEQRSDEFDRRRRRLLLTFVVSTMVTVAGMGATVALRVADASRPGFVLLVPEPVAEFRPRPADPEPEPDPAREDELLRLGLEVPTPAPRPPRPRADSPLVATPPVRDTVPAIVESVLAAGRPPPELLTPVTPPPPAAPPLIAAPRPDPAVRMALARSEVEAAAQRLVQAVNGRNVQQVAALLAGSDARRRDRFVQFVRESGPAATMEGVDQPVVSEAGAEGGFTVGFRWRADFGVQRQRSARFLAVLQPAGDAWTFQAVRMVEAFP